MSPYVCNGRGKINEYGFASSFASAVPGWMWVSVALLLISLPWIQNSVAEERWASLKKEVVQFQKWEKTTVQELHKTTLTIEKLDGTIRAIQHANERLLSDMRINRRQLSSIEQRFTDTEKIEDALLLTIDRLEGHIQEKSRDAIIRQYGEGPHLVEIAVSPKLATGGLNIGGQYNFTLQLAPPDLLPHSVHTFLRMVNEKIWDGLAFVHRARTPHVIQATPLQISTATKVHRKFEAAHLNQLAFSEYSSEYPHLHYTVGFSRKGPDFYVNTQNNAEFHGPSSDDEFTDDAEPCFGRIISGRHVLDQLVQDSGDPNEIRLFEIKSVRLVQ